MTPERWQVVKDLFQRATLQHESMRTAFLERVCAGDSVLRAEVAALLASDAAATSFIEVPAELRILEPRYSDIDCAMPTIGSLVAHYRIVSLLGAGGMGRVYLAEDI